MRVELVVKIQSLSPHYLIQVESLTQQKTPTDKQQCQGQREKVNEESPDVFCLARDFFFWGWF
jgi:hypothetical protein